MQHTYSTTSTAEVTIKVNDNLAAANYSLKGAYFDDEVPAGHMTITQVKSYGPSMLVVGSVIGATADEMPEVTAEKYNIYFDGKFDGSEEEKQKQEDD